MCAVALSEHPCHDRKHKKEKKKKKHKSKKKKKESSSSYKSMAVNQDEYGAHGVIREEHFHEMQEEFDVWVREIKKLEGFNGSKVSLACQETFG